MEEARDPSVQKLYDLMKTRLEDTQAISVIWPYSGAQPFGFPEISEGSRRATRPVPTNIFDLSVRFTPPLLAGQGFQSCMACLAGSIGLADALEEIRSGLGRQLGPHDDA
jgi:hypothetical protein